MTGQPYGCPQKPINCSASGGSFWDRPPGCACLFWIQSGRGLDCSTSLPWGGGGGLDLSQQSANRHKVGLWNSLVGGRRYLTLAKWVTEVGHWPSSSLGNFSVITETHFCGANRVALMQCELLLPQLHLHKIQSTDNLHWPIGEDRAYELPTRLTSFGLQCSTAISTRAGFVFTINRR